MEEIRDVLPPLHKDLHFEIDDDIAHIFDILIPED